MGSCCGAGAEAKAAMAAAGGAWAKIEKVKDALQSWPAILAAAVALVASFVMAGHGCGVHGAVGWHGWRQAADPALIPLFICGLPILKEAVQALVAERRIRAALLISVAMVSCVAIGQLFAAGEVAFIMALGEKLEAFTVSRAKKGIRRLASLVPETARYIVTCPKCLAQGIRFKDLPLGEIAVGDSVKILPGETIPLDGIVEEGETTVDESVMTGESMPVDKAPGDEVCSGTINRYGAIAVKVSRTADESSLQKLVRMVKEAEGRKAPMQRIADRWAGILVPCSMAIAVLTFFGVWAWYAANPASLPPDATAMGEALIRGVTIMVVFCPCALALATPTSIMAAIGQAAKFGVVIKSGEALERMGEVDTVCFDKTGTLTEGKLAVDETVSFLKHIPSARVLQLAASVEASSEHPLAKAIVARAGAFIEPASGFEMKPGRGAKGVADGMAVVCGTAGWLAENGVEVSKEAGCEAGLRRDEGKAVVFVAVDGTLAGFISLADEPRAGAKAAVEDIRSLGVEPVLLTGDHEATARFVAQALGIAACRAALLPEGKAAAIDEMERGGRRVLMVGDGVNDAIALKTAHVGMAMGGAGSDIAVEAADIALVGDDLGRIGYLKRLSVACVKLIKTNIAISMTINACAILCSILGLLGPVTGALVHNCGSALVILNGALLYDRKLR